VEYSVFNVTTFSTDRKSVQFYGVRNGFSDLKYDYSVLRLKTVLYYVELCHVLRIISVKIFYLSLASMYLRELIK